MKSLFILTLIAAANFAADQPELVPGAVVHNVPDEAADRLVNEGFARLATVAEIEGTAPPVIPDGPKDATPAVKGKRTKVRLLIDSDYGKANAVVFVAAKAVKSAKEAGLMDDDVDAVAYAEGLLDKPVVDELADAEQYEQDLQDPSTDVSAITKGAKPIQSGKPPKDAKKISGTPASKV